MDYELELTGPESDEAILISLQDWLQKEQITGSIIGRKVHEPKEGDMGIEPSEILSIVLGSAALVELIKSIHVWLNVRKPKVSIILRKDNCELEIQGKNLRNIDEIVEKTLKIFDR